MPHARVSHRFRVDKRVLDRELQGRDGAVGYVIAGFAGVVTKEIKNEMRARASGAFWPVHSSITSGPRGVQLTVTVRQTKPHQIVAKNVPLLIFFWERAGRMFFGPSVNHPGSSPPEKLVLSGVERASRSVRVTAAAPTVTRSAT